MDDDYFSNNDFRFLEFDYYIAGTFLWVSYVLTCLIITTAHKVGTSTILILQVRVWTKGLGILLTAIKYQVNIQTEAIKWRSLCS